MIIVSTTTEPSEDGEGTYKCITFFVDGKLMFSTDQAGLRCLARVLEGIESSGVGWTLISMQRTGFLSLRKVKTSEAI